MKNHEKAKYILGCIFYILIVVSFTMVAHTEAKKSIEKIQQEIETGIPITSEIQEKIDRINYELLPIDIVSVVGLLIFIKAITLKPLSEKTNVSSEEDI